MSDRTTFAISKDIIDFLFILSIIPESQKKEILNTVTKVEAGHDRGFGPQQKKKDKNFNSD